MLTKTEALQLAEATFRAYGDHHAAKPDDEKAQRNYQLADTMRAALLEAVPDAPLPPAAPQEPVAWRVRPFDYGIGHEGVDALTTRKEQCEMWERKGWKVDPLYTAPQPPRQPLTEDQLRDALRQCPHDTTENLRVRWLYAKDFARAVEAAHGIIGGQQ